MLSPALLAPAPPPPILANAVTFDGASACLTKAADLAGNADSYASLTSCWFKRSGGVGTRMTLLASVGAWFRLWIETSNLLKAEIDDTPGTSALIFSSTAALTDTSWHHLLVALGTNYPAGQKQCQVYLDDVALAGTVTDAQAAFLGNYARTAWGVASSSSAAALWTGSIAELWMANAWPVPLFDLSLTKNRRKFITAGGKPANLGLNGVGPTGRQPIIYLPNAAGTVGTNQGYGGNFTINGAPSAGAAP